MATNVEPGQHPDAEPFLRALAMAEKSDPLSRLYFADWLDENGYDRAALGQRWAARMKKSPERDPNGSGGWFDAGRVAHMDPSIDPSEFQEISRRLNDTYPHYLPSVFFKYHDRLWDETMDPLEMERHFLNASHRIGYTEEGEPTDPLFHGMSNEEVARRAAVSND
jgi:uncharacterized protein (TIGR02996 family)